MKQLTKVFFLLALVFSMPVLAKTSDQNAPLHIEADQLEMREKEGISIYKGHVKITKGSLKITGDNIVITQNKNGKLDKIHINGKPATFFQLNDLGEEISAESSIINYQAQSGRLELKEKALLLKNKNRFSSEHIIYDTLTDIVKAGNHNAVAGTETPRVKITIYPEPSKNKVSE